MLTAATRVLQVYVVRSVWSRAAVQARAPKPAVNNLLDVYTAIRKLLILQVL